MPTSGSFAMASEFIMICVANAFPYKGHADLLAALRRVGPALPEPWRMILIGRGTEQFKGTWRVKCYGYRSDAAQLLAATDLFILPSHEEGSSNALLEAMKAGVPVIATDVGGNKDAIIHDYSGLLVPPRSPALLGAAILRMLDPNLRRQYARMAQLDVSIRFSLDRCLDEYEALYRSAHLRATGVY